MKISIIGSGAWGTTIAQIASENFDTIFLWSKNEKVIKSINTTNINCVYLDGFKLSKNITATSDINIFLDTQLIFIVLPCQSIRQVLLSLKHVINSDAKIIICSKGIENETLLLMSEVVHHIVPNHVFFLSGPNFAKEIMHGLPSFANLAGNIEIAKFICRKLSTKKFIIKPISNLKGAQIASALKNVIAIFCGMIKGKNLGLNTQAAIITIALEEIKQFCKAHNADHDILLDFCGIGDLVLTCCSEYSRNMHLGKSIIESTTTDNQQLTEGLYTLKAAYQISTQYGIDSPIVNSLYDVIYKHQDPHSTIDQFFDKLMYNNKCI